MTPSRPFAALAALAAAVLWLTGCAGAADPAAARTGRGWLAVSANDHKAVLVDGVTRLLPNPTPDTLSLIDLRGPVPRLVGELAVPTTVVGPPVAVAVAPDESIALVTAGKKPAGGDNVASDNRLSVVDLQARPPRLLATLTVGAGAAGVSINRAGTLALVANRDEGTVSVLRIRGTEVQVLGKLALGDAKSGPSAVAITPDGRRAFVSRDGDSRISVLAIDGETVTDTQRVLYAGQRPYPIDLCGSTGLGITGNVGLGNGDEDTVSLFDANASPPRVIDTLSVGQTPEGAVCSPDGRWVAVTVMSGSNKPAASPFYRAAGRVVVLRIEGRRLVLHGQADVGNWSQGALFSPDGRTLLVQNMVQKTISVLAVDERGVRDTGQTLAMPGGPASIRAAQP